MDYYTRVHASYRSKMNCENSSPSPSPSSSLYIHAYLSLKSKDVLRQEKQRHLSFPFPFKHLVTNEPSSWPHTIDSSLCLVFARQSKRNKRTRPSPFILKDAALGCFDTTSNSRLLATLPIFIFVHRNWRTEIRNWTNEWFFLSLHYRNETPTRPNPVCGNGEKTRLTDIHRQLFLSRYFMHTHSSTLAWQITGRNVLSFTHHLVWRNESAWAVKKDRETIDLRGTAGWSKNQQTWLEKFVSLSLSFSKDIATNGAQRLFAFFFLSFSQRFFPEPQTNAGWEKEKQRLKISVDTH